MLAGLVTGSSEPEQWGVQGRRVDFFDMKADLMAVLSLTLHSSEIRFVPEAHPSLHPGQSARIYKGEVALGWIGMLHPEIERKLDLKENAYLFEILINELLTGELPGFHELSRYPSIRRDIAVVVDEQISFSEIQGCIRQAAPGILKDLLLFDVYTGNKIDSGLKSLALGLILQETSHTLTDKEVDSVMERVLQALKQDLDAQLRD
jgi:phenylalanyl-tRNA synthetase beta chain